MGRELPFARFFRIASMRPVESESGNSARGSGTDELTDCAQKCDVQL